MHDAPTPAPASAAARRVPLAERSTLRELLDAGDLPPDELRRNLTDLARLNRLPGGASASVAAIGGLVRSRRAAILDVGTGGGDLALAFARRGWAVTGVDVDPAVAERARALTAVEARVRIVEADGRALPFDDASFEVAHASLLVHHLDPPDAVAVLAEMARVARRGVVVNDLRRGLLPLAATAVAVVALGRCRTTRHDGIMSVRRAYRLVELDRLLADAGLRVIARSAGWMPRVVTTAVAMEAG